MTQEESNYTKQYFYALISVGDFEVVISPCKDELNTDLLVYSDKKTYKINISQWDEEIFKLLSEKGINIKPKIIKVYLYEA